jgi:4a-hydroxytetrahydrobiopterin dehydratase
MVMALLSQEEITRARAELSGWIFAGNALERRYKFADFAAAMSFVNVVAELAEAANHHPDIDVRYNKVKLSLSSHDAGGITSRDIKLAKKINSI